MKLTFRKSLFGKLSIGFALLLTILGGVQVFLVIPRYQQVLDEIDQQLAWDLASDLAELLHPYFEQGVRSSELSKKLREYSLVNPGIDIFLLDENGNVLARSELLGDPERVLSKVDIEPVRKAVSHSSPKTPLYGLHPNARVKNRRRPFSAAAIHYNGSPGYLYVMLRNPRFEKNVQFFGQRLLVVSSVVGLVVVSSVSVILAGLLFFYLSRHFLALTEVVEEYRAGNYQRRVRVETEDEIAQLALAVNSMADQIVDDQRQRKQLVAAISHDLRTPLTSIRGFIEMLTQSNPEIEKETRQSYLESIHSNVLVQERLLEDLTELSKLQTAEIVPHIEPSALDDLIDDVILKYRGAAAGKGVQIVAELPESVPMLEFDLVLIERVLANLLSNAIHYAGEGSTVALSLEVKEDAVITSVTDDGPGIAAEDLEHLAETFYRVEKHRSADARGRGLGLAIVKEILEIHHSALEVQSAVGVGSTFSFSLAR